ncbi:hypothetical protein Tco_1438831 [Tanacetum coccineum]
MYNWETAKYGKINYIGDINYLRFFETKFPAIVYDDALSSQHVDEVNWKNETSLSEYDDGKYNAISERKAIKKRFSKKEKFNILSIDKDQFSYDIFSVNDLKSNKDNVEDKIGLNTIEVLNEIDEGGGMYIFWYSMCCSHVGIQTLFAAQHKKLLINSAWRIIPSKSQGSFSL